MREKDKLISYAIKYNGSYDRIKYAISSREDIREIKCDNCITIFDDEYPRKFLDLKDPPFVLFYKGDISLLKESSIGVVGSRRPCDYSLAATKLLALNNKDRVIVSGLARGIDGMAHKYAYKSIGVLGCGIDYIYPKENEYLYKRLEKEGLIISEYPFNTVPFPYNFPFRNRIIAALSDEIYIMEAHEKSGTLTTINAALELGKDIKVLPFDIFKKEGEYNNYLISEGASIINIEDLINNHIN